MNEPPSFLASLVKRGVSRRSFLRFCAITASSLALSGKEARFFATALAAGPKPTAIWLSFQQCTGCSESILRAFNPTLESLILNSISLDYHETLQAAAGYQAEKARIDAMEAAYGRYILIIDGSIPSGETEFWSCAAGNSNLASLREAVDGAALVIALGTCATFGGIPAAYPNPSHASGYADLVAAGLIKGTGGKALPPHVNLSGCPPLAEVITGTIAHFVVNQTLPALDSLKRPLVYYGKTVHDSCPRLPHFNARRFALSHGDAAARQGYCLLHLGCRGPETHNACTALGWNRDPKDNGAFTHSPTHSGHGCLGCAEPKFWDHGYDPGTTTFRSFYTPD